MNPTPPRILTNMAFWQSELWCRHADSIYDLDAVREHEQEYPPLKTAWELIKRHRTYDVVMTMGARESLAYGLLCLLLLQPRKQIMTEVFIDDVEHPGLLWRIKTALYRLAARRALGIITNSSVELDTMADRYRLPKNRFRYVPLNTNIRNPEWTDRNDGYVFSAGRTLRDYPSLIEAVRDLDVPVKIVCGRDDLAGIDLPSNVEVYREVSKTEYLDLLRGAAIVALPLLPTQRSTGQVVVLEAMALGKPVITTRAPGTLDHVTDKMNGRLLPPGDVEALRTAIQHWLDHPDLAESCARRALEDVKEKFTVERHAELRLAAVLDMAQINSSV